MLDDTDTAPESVPPCAFCLEQWGTEGGRAEVLAGLSTGGGAALALVVGSGMANFHDYRDGARVEMFKPGMSYSPRGERPHRFYERTEEIARRGRGRRRRSVRSCAAGWRVRCQR